MKNNTEKIIKIDNVISHLTDAISSIEDLNYFTYSTVLLKQILEIYQDLHKSECNENMGTEKE